jgi:hypothetical protein
MSNGKSKKRAFESHLVMTIEQYKTLMARDVASSQVGSNIKAINMLNGIR